MSIITKEAAKKLKWERAQVWVETPKAILDPVRLGDKSYKDLLEANEEAEALWVLLPGHKEPFRVPWNIGLFSNIRTPNCPKPQRATARRSSKSQRQKATAS